MPHPLPPFIKFERFDFHIGGNPALVAETAHAYHTFGAHATEASARMAATRDGGFEGSEGDRYKQLLNADFPKHLATTGESHTKVGGALDVYVAGLTKALSEMGLLTTKGLADHTACNAAFYEWLSASINAKRATATAAATATTAAATAIVPGVNAATAAAAASAQADAAAAIAAEQAALAHWEGLHVIWEQDLAAARAIKAALQVEVESAVQLIQAAPRAYFAENSDTLKDVWNSITDFCDEHSELLKGISDALQVVGGIMMLIPGLQVVGGVLLGVGIGLKAILAATGNCSWLEVGFDAVTAGPLGALGKAAKAGKLGTSAMKAATGASSIKGATLSAVKAGANKAALKSADGIAFVGGKYGQDFAKSYYRTITRGKEICFAAEPVDMATGNMVDFTTDISIDGILPLIVDRNANTAHQLGRALGPRWVSTMDTRIEVTADEVLFLTGDGALLTFPHAPVSGDEVDADVNGWKLSYADGAYRIRNIRKGLTYEFSLASDNGYVAAGPVKDSVPHPNGSHQGGRIHAASLANATGTGIEIGLTALIHHTGHAISFTWDPTTGTMTRMTRSDNTRLEITYDHAVNRVASIWVSNPVTHPDQAPMRLISYAYDASGNLVRVTNSHNGVLRYHYDETSRITGWTDRNGASYYYRFDDKGRVSSQVGTGGMFPNILFWAPDTGTDAPVGGGVCVLLETATEFSEDPLSAGDRKVEDYLRRLEQLPLYKALCEEGLQLAGLTGRGRTAERDNESWSIPAEWLHDDILGDIRPTVYRSTPEGDVWRVVSPEGHVSDFQYDTNHQVCSYTNSAGATTTTEYNADGLAVATHYPDGTSTYIEPGDWATPVRAIDRNGYATDYEVDPFGLTTAVTNPAGVRTHFEYDIRPSGAVPKAVIDPDGHITTIECDDAGRQLAVTDPAQRRTSSTLDVRGLITSTMDPDGNTVTIDYTPEGWPTKITQADGSTITATYDGEGNQLSVTNECGATTRTEYTVFDKPIATIDATGAVTRLAYNTQMEPVTLTNADGNTWTYHYNLDGKITRETDYNGITTESTVSPDGLTAQITSPAGLTTTKYNSLGLTETVVDGSGTTSFSYDQLGRIAKISTPLTSVTYSRDEYGRITSETVSLVSGESTTHARNFTPTGVVAEQSLTLPNADTIRTSYKRNEAGEISASSITHALPDSNTPAIVADLAYGQGSRGERARITVGSLVRTFEHDSRGRITTDHTGLLSSMSATGLAPVASRRFAWREDSHLTSITDQLRGTTSFELDPLGRVIGLHHDTSRIGPSPEQSPAERSLSPGSDSAVSGFGRMDETYGFSSAGVLNSITTPQVSAPGAITNDAIPTSVGNVSDSRIEFRGTMPTRIGRTTYRYDPAGRITQTVTKRLNKKPLVHNFYYATGEQPIGFDSSDEPGIGYRYIYDGLGRRVAKERIDTTNGYVLERTMFAHFANQLVAEQKTKGTNRGKGYVWTHDPDTNVITGQIQLTSATSDTEPTDVLSWDQHRVDAEFFALVADLAEAPQEIINPVNGEVVGRSKQTLYGQRTWQGEQSSPLLFAGQYFDDESGWAYNRFRYYNPQTGSYNAQDPLGAAPRIASPQGYVDNATSWVDPLGLHTHTKLGFPNQFNPNKQVPLDTYAGRRWRVGDHPMDPMKDGRRPSRGTERKRFWKNEAAFNAEAYNSDQLERMRAGKAPQRFSPDLLEYQIKHGWKVQDGFESKELSHEPLSRAEGGLQSVPRWPAEHAKVDAQRHVPWAT